MEIKHVNGYSLTPAQSDRAALRKAAEGFEELFLNQFLKAAHSGHLADDIMGGGGVDQFQSMFDSEISKSASGRTGFGIADAVERQFDRFVKKDS